jgi:predicted HNH restriction endonuclease
MRRRALALHVIEKGGRKKEHLLEVQPRTQIWETGFWKVSDETAESLVGGKIYVHKGQKVPSHIGGKVISFRSEAGGRKVFRFRADSKLRNVVATTGWANEKRVVWEGLASGLKRFPSEDDESAFAEGAEKFRLHRARERDPKLASAAKRKRLDSTGALKCEVCSFDFAAQFGMLGAGYIEAHHTTPVSELAGTRKTKLAELALVCANCHRMLHRSIPLLDIPGLRAVITGEV